MARQFLVLQEINDENNSPQLASTSTGFGGQNVPDMGDVSFLQPLIRYIFNQRLKRYLINKLEDLISNQDFF